MCNLGKLQTLPEILRGFHDFSGSPVISNCGTPKENMSGLSFETSGAK